jgi:hypothetical protein
VQPKDYELTASTSDYIAIQSSSSELFENVINLKAHNAPEMLLFLCLKLSIFGVLL